MWGGTGQAKVIGPIVESHGHRIVAVFDRNPDVPPPFADVPLISDETALAALFSRYRSRPLAFAVAVAGQHGAARVEIGESLEGRGFTPLSPMHERAWVAASAHLGAGCQVLAMAVVAERAALGRYCIVNTSASVDHECRLGDGVHVMPGATLAGCVVVGAHATIGSNATVLPRLRIGADAFVGAGAVVAADVDDGATVAGNPARPLDAR